MQNIFFGKNAINKKSLHIVKEESADVKLAKEEIDRAVAMLENGNDKDAILICKTINEKALNKSCKTSDAKIIKDSLFEIGLEVALAGNIEIAREILAVVDDLEIAPLDACGMNYYSEATTCFIVCDPSLSSEERSSKAFLLKEALKKAIKKKEHLKCAPYFLGKAYENGLYGIAKSNTRAKEYLQIANERGYTPRTLTLMKNRSEEHTLLEFQ